MVHALARLAPGDLLLPTSTDFLLDLTSQSRTDPERLKAGLASG